MPGRPGAAAGGSSAAREAFGAKPGVYWAPRVGAVGTGLCGHGSLCWTCDWFPGVLVNELGE